MEENEIREIKPDVSLLRRRPSLEEIADRNLIVRHQYVDNSYSSLTLWKKSSALMELFLFFNPAVIELELGTV